MCLIVNTRKVKRLVTVLVVWMSLAGSLTGYAQLNVVATVNDQNIEIEEVKREMLRYQAAVMNTFIKSYQLTDLKNFWTKDFDGKKPLEELRKKALDTLVFIKVQEELFKSKDLWPYLNYAALVNDMKDVNLIRKKMVENNKVIYGPIIFSERTFFDYQFSNAIIKAKDKLKKTRFNVSDSTLLLHLNKMRTGIFANNKESFEELRSRVETNYIDNKYDTLIRHKVSTAIVKINQNVLNKILIN